MAPNGRSTRRMGARLCAPALKPSDTGAAEIPSGKMHPLRKEALLVSPDSGEIIAWPGSAIENSLTARARGQGGDWTVALHFPGRRAGHGARDDLLCLAHLRRQAANPRGHWIGNRRLDVFWRGGPGSVALRSRHPGLYCCVERTGQDLRRENAETNAVCVAPGLTGFVRSGVRFASALPLPPFSTQIRNFFSQRRGFSTFIPIL